uniref:Uncharacterized protein n=1 Tax=Aureoumbra lagunensis TaxID=44058 RepID=A0A7S3JWH6_9STRA
MNEDIVSDDEQNVQNEGTHGPLYDNDKPPSPPDPPPPNVAPQSPPSPRSPLGLPCAYPRGSGMDAPYPRPGGMVVNQSVFYSQPQPFYVRYGQYYAPLPYSQQYLQPQEQQQFFQQSNGKRPNKYRTGHWTHDEEVYADKVKELFMIGKIPYCPEEITLRALLAKLLNCTPMRVSKKYTKENALGKWVYRQAIYSEEKDPNSNGDSQESSSSSSLSKEQEELKRCEKNFHRSLGGITHLKYCIFDTPNLMTLCEYNTVEGRHTNQMQAHQMRNGIAPILLNSPTYQGYHQST